MIRGGALLAALILIGSISGCGSTAVVGRSGETPIPSASQPSTGSGQESDDPELIKLKKEAGLPDCPTSDPDVAPVESGLPDLVLNCLGGGTPTRLAGLRGTPMVINVWAQWCGPCRTEAPFLASVSKAAGDQVQFIGIDFADPRPELAIEFAALSDWDYPQLVDQDKAIAQPLRVPAPPISFFVDASGLIVSVHAGAFQSAEQLEDLISEHLGVSL